MTKYRLLFIDDEEPILRALGNYFIELGHEVHTATSGKEGLGLFDQVEPHVVVLDLQMPEMSGMEVLEVLRPKRAVVLMLTGHGEIESAVQAMRLGAENFLQKPVDMPHLVAAVEKAAEKADLRRENRELRARLHPSTKRQIMRVVLLLALVTVAVGIGAIIGSEGGERPMVPIPIPIEQDTVFPAPGDAPVRPGDSLP